MLMDEWPMTVCRRLGVQPRYWVNSDAAAWRSYAVGKAPAATSTSTLLPLNWVEILQVPAGSQISALSNDSTAGTLSVTELT
jgi:hypothetical protein